MKNKNDNVGRRDFLRKTTSAAIAATIIPGHVIGRASTAFNNKSNVTGLDANMHVVRGDPGAVNYAGNKGETIYVSKLGNNTDGSSWQKAFNTIQSALLAVPDDKGGHTVVVRPDTYVEANLYPAQKGAVGAYNLLIGDSDGSLGSGATGWVIIDTSCPGVAVRRVYPDMGGTYKIIESDLPEAGFKSMDYWSSFLVGPGPAAVESANRFKFSSLSWDRWIFRNLYTSGSDAGFFFDIDMLIDGLSSLDDEKAEGKKGFTVIVDKCVGIARAFGGGVCYPVARPDEPSVFRHSFFLGLDTVGDSAAVLIGGREKTMPEHPHLILEDCTLVHPLSPLAMSYANNCARVKLIDCRLISLMMTQKEMGGDKTATGIIRTRNHGRLHVDLEDCILAGYSVFTPNEASEAASYTTKGKVQAYVHYRKQVPKGFEQLGLWPHDLFSQIAPPAAPGR
jgi:hypothetical protein